MFIRGGTILPILLHDDCLALLDCIKNDIKLDVYLDQTNQAHGSLYLDDGTSFDYMDKQSKLARFRFDYTDGTVESSVIFGDDYAGLPNVTSVKVFGIQSAPVSVQNSKGQSIEFVYDDIQ